MRKTNKTEDYTWCWYVSRDNNGAYFFGQTAVKDNEPLEQVVEAIKEALLTRKGLVLTLIVEAHPLLPLLNQIWPESVTEESKISMDLFVRTMYGE